MKPLIAAMPVEVEVKIGRTWAGIEESESRFLSEIMGDIELHLHFARLGE
jgi:hypothetical protein